MNMSINNGNHGQMNLFILEATAFNHERPETIKYENHVATTPETVKLFMGWI